MSKFQVIDILMLQTQFRKGMSIGYLLLAYEIAANAA